MSDTSGSAPDRNVVRPRTFEEMEESEVEEIMEQRRRKADRPEWNKDRFGDDRPLSAWDFI
jgi:hypothetical protein